MQASALGKQIQQVGENLGSAKEHRSGLISRQKLLTDLEARREGVSEGVKSVLRERDTVPVSEPAAWPPVVAVVPARDEAEVIQRSIGSAGAKRREAGS